MKKNKGVTLIELVVSMVIFGAVIAGVAMFNARNTKAVIRSERNVKRTLLQESAIEEFKGWLKASSVPGSRFDGIWADNSAGDILFSKTDPETGIGVVLEIDSFIPSDTCNVSDVGVRLKINVISTDPDLNINETNVAFVSRHD
jgi:prepilin-type N-terminal cleavage/methylation domain-containing protein